MRIASNAYDAADRADAVVIATEWDEFASIDLDKLAEHMKGTLVLDGRGVISESRR